MQMSSYGRQPKQQAWRKLGRDNSGSREANYSRDGEENRSSHGNRRGRRAFGKSRSAQKTVKDEGVSTRSGRCVATGVSLGLHLSTEVKARPEGAWTKQTAHSVFTNNSQGLKHRARAAARETSKGRQAVLQRAWAARHEHGG